MKKIILLLIGLTFLSCKGGKGSSDKSGKDSSNTDPIIGEWYQVGVDFGNFAMKKPFHRSTNVKMKFTNDSLYSWATNGTVLNSEYKILKEGDTSKTIRQGLDKWVKQGNTYIAGADNQYFEINGDTLISYTLNDFRNKTLIYYFFKK